MNTSTYKKVIKRITNLFNRRREAYINGIKVTQTNKGSHETHWYSVFDTNTQQQVLIDRITNGIETGKKITIHNSLDIITDPIMRNIVRGNYVITGFPYLRGLRYDQYEVKIITEWSHVDNREAVIKARHTSGCGIDFFATDYAINKDIYKTGKELAITIVGLVYVMSEFKADGPPVDGFTLAEDFCGYFPRSADEIQFIGRIQHVAEHSLGEIAGYLFIVGITPDFAMEFFIARHRLSFELTHNKHVSGVAWIQGTIEK